jgi:hypothetical protein
MDYEQTYQSALTSAALALFVRSALLTDRRCVEMGQGSVLCKESLRQRVPTLGAWTLARAAEGLAASTPGAANA